MTSTLEGRTRRVVDKQTKVLISCVSGTVTGGGGGIKKSENFADIIKGSPLMASDLSYQLSRFRRMTPFRQSFHEF